MNGTPPPPADETDPTDEAADRAAASVPEPRVHRPPAHPTSPGRPAGRERLDTLAAMTDGQQQTRTVLTVNRGAKLCLLVAALLLLFAAYLFFVPLDIQTQEGPMFNCGSAARPPTAAFPKTVCGRLSQTAQLRAGFAAGGAVVTALGGLLVFGVTRRTAHVDPAAGRRRDADLDLDDDQARSESSTR
jgi:hypothetical protein